MTDANRTADSKCMALTEDTSTLLVIAQERLRQAAARLKRANAELDEAEREHTRAAGVLEHLEKQHV